MTPNPSRSYAAAIAHLCTGPSVAAFISTHGVEFGPRKVGVGRRGVLKECFKNAYELLQSHPALVYVEGFAVGHAIPVHHAWCVTLSGEVIDPTWDPNIGTHYFGIPFSRPFVETRITRQTHYGLLDSPESGFELVRGLYSDFLHPNWSKG